MVCRMMIGLVAFNWLVSLPALAQIGDTAPPQLLGLSIEPRTVDVSDGPKIVTFTLHLADNLSGININLPGSNSLLCPSGDPARIPPRVSGFQAFGSTPLFQFEHPFFQRFNLISGNLLDGFWQFQVSISIKGSYQLGVVLVDRACNGVALSPSQLQTLGFDPTFTVVSNKTPVIVIPGVMGTSLYEGPGESNLIWLKCSDAAQPGPDDFLNQLLLDASGNSIFDIHTGAIFDGSLSCLLLDKYGGLIRALSNAGYQRDRTLFVFPYDWRLDNTRNAALLHNFIEHTVIPDSGQHKVDILAHSMGGLLTRAYANEYGQSRLDKVVYIGTPHRGAPKAFASLSFNNSPGGIQFRFINAQTLARLVATLPSAFQLLPRDPFIVTENSTTLALDQSYLDPPQGFGFLRNSAWVSLANTFHSLISLPITVPQYVIAGTGIPTLGGLKLRGDPATEPGSWCAMTANGDETVPVASATVVVPGTSTQRFFVNNVAHDALPNNTTVQQLVINILNSNSSVTMPPGVSTTPFPIVGRPINWCTHSPIKVLITDANGNVDGLGLDGSIRNEIPFSSFFQFDENEGGLLPSNGPYQVGITGTAIGLFSIDFNYEDSQGTAIQTIKFPDVPVTVGSVGSLILQPNDPTPTLAMDVDGNGTVDVSLPANRPVEPGVATQILSLIIGTVSLNRGIQQSLLAKVDAANSAIRAGRSNEAKNILGALWDEISAQLGKQVPANQGNGLLTIVGQIIRQL